MDLARVPGCKLRFCVMSIKWNDTAMYEIKIDAHSASMRRGLAHNCFRYKKPGFLPRTPLPPEWAIQLFVWDGTVYRNLLCLFEGGAGGPSPKVRAFCNSGWPDMWQSLPMDCLPILNKPHKYSPPKKKTTIRDAQIQTATNPMQDRNFGMFRGQRSTLGNGLSGEPRPRM